MVDISPDDAEALRAKVERSRAELAETADALVAKTDVPARAKDSVMRAGALVGSRVTTVAGRTGGVIGYALGRVAGIGASLRPGRRERRLPLPMMVVVPAAGVLMRLVGTVVGGGE